MRFIRIHSLLLAFTLLFSTSLFAQLEALEGIDANSTEEEIAAAVETAIADGAAPAAVAQALITNNVPVAQVTTALVSANVPPAQIASSLATAGQNTQQIATAMVAAEVPAADVASGLSALGQTPAQITTALVSAAVPAAEATVAVRTAVPTATNAQLNQGLAAAGVSADAAQTAIAAAPAPAPAPAVAPPTAPVAAVTGSGLLVGANGQAVVVQNEADQLAQVLAFVEQTSRNNPDALSNPETLQGISAIIGNALSSAAGGAVSSAEATQTILTQLAVAAETGQSATDVLNGALTAAIDQIEEETGETIDLPPSVSPS